MASKNNDETPDEDAPQGPSTCVRDTRAQPTPHPAPSPPLFPRTPRANHPASLERPRRCSSFIMVVFRPPPPLSISLPPLLASASVALPLLCPLPLPETTHTRLPARARARAAVAAAARAHPVPAHDRIHVQCAHTTARFSLSPFLPIYFHF